MLHFMLDFIQMKSSNKCLCKHKPDHTGLPGSPWGFRSRPRASRTLVRGSCRCCQANGGLLDGNDTCARRPYQLAEAAIYTVVDIGSRSLLSIVVRLILCACVDSTLR